MSARTAASSETYIDWRGGVHDVQLLHTLGESSERPRGKNSFSLQRMTTNSHTT